MQSNAEGDLSQVARGCGALVVNEEGEVLLLKRSSASRNDRGMWSQPGGGVDPGESIVDSIVREIREEIGVEVLLHKFLTTTYHADDSKSWLAYSYLATIARGEPKRLEPSKHDELRWFSISNLPEALNAVTRESVDAYLRRKTPASPRGLIVFDMDGTLLRNTTANLELARQLNRFDEVVALESQFLDGRIGSDGYAAGMIDLYSELNESAVLGAFDNTELLDGIDDLVSWAHSFGFVVALITTGPQFFADHFKTRHGFDFVFGADFPLDRELLKAGKYRVLHSEEKPVIAKRLCERLGLPLSRCVAIGDSLSDVPLFKAFANSIALNGHSSIEGLAAVRVRTDYGQDLVPAIKALFDGAKV